MSSTGVTPIKVSNNVPEFFIYKIRQRGKGILDDVGIKFQD